MNRGIILTVLVLLCFSTWFNPTLTHASFNKTPHNYSKSTIANSSTIWVPDNHTTIQEAINKANEEDTIFVRAGTYYENLTINKSISLIGENKQNTIIDGNGTGTVIHITANNVNISNLTIQNADLGIWLWYSNDNVFVNNIISNNSFGIYLYFSAGNVLSNNTASNNRYGIQFYFSAGNVLSGNTVSNNSYGIYVWRSSNNTFIGNTVSYNQEGIRLSYSSNNTLTGNTVLSNREGIRLSYSNDNTLTGNTALNNSYGEYLYFSAGNVLSGNTVSNNSYGIYVWRSNDNTLSGNTASHNSHGVYLSYSAGNVLSGNNASNNSYGIYIDSSSYNTLTDNTISLNNDDGIRLYHSNNNVLSGNNASNNQYGIYVGDSDNNVLSGSIVSYNSYGIYFYYSRDNILTDNIATNNQYGIHLSYSSTNKIFHNNFINNTEPPNSIESINFWDNGAEGNYWSDYDGTDANWDGIGDTPYAIDIDTNSQDNYPLMAVFLQFNIATENQSYKINTICNSTISNFQFTYDPDNRINAINFKVNGTQGKGFCRISIPNTLIEPPHTITIDHNPPLSFKIVYTNGTHTWLYFTHAPSEHEVTITHMSYPEQLVLSQWAIVGLTVIIIILLSININYYRKLNKQKKVIEAYERELGSFPVSHSERARLRFVKDVIERKEKIERFKRKYRIKVQPANTLEGLMKKMGLKKEKEKES